MKLKFLILYSYLNIVKLSRKDHKADWKNERDVSKILEHPKIITGRIFTKNGVDFAVPNFEVFPTYKMLGKIALNIKTWREGYPKLI